MSNFNILHKNHLYYEEDIERIRKGQSFRDYCPTCQGQEFKMIFQSKYTMIYACPCGKKELALEIEY